MYIERDGKKYQVEGTLYIQGAHIVRRVKETLYTTGTVYELKKEQQEIPIVEGEELKHFPGIKLAN